MFHVERDFGQSAPDLSGRSVEEELSVTYRCSTWNLFLNHPETQNYSLPTDVPRGTLNNDSKATSAQTASKATKG